MRVNVYAEEMTDRLEVISKEIEGQKFTGLRFYLELPVTSPILRGKDDKPLQMRGPFMHHPGDDDSAAVTFWGKQDLRKVLQQALTLLDTYYATPSVSWQADFDSTIGGLDRVLSKLVNWGRSVHKHGHLEVDEPNAQTLKHHAEDMIAAGEKILENLGWAVQGTPQPQGPQQ